MPCGQPYKGDREGYGYFGKLFELGPGIVPCAVLNQFFLPLPPVIQWIADRNIESSIAYLLFFQPGNNVFIFRHFPCAFDFSIHNDRGYRKHRMIVFFVCGHIDDVILFCLLLFPCNIKPVNPRKRMLDLLNLTGIFQPVDEIAYHIGCIGRTTSVCNGIVYP